MTSAVCYKDPRAALDWLAKAFGFELAMVITDANGDIGHSEMRYRARDPEGHIWTFGRTVKEVTPEEWDKASGLTTKMYP